MNEDFWEKNAEPWTRAIQSHSIESRKVTNPAIIDELARLKPRHVLDLGCGEGWIASHLVPKGIKYTGLDFSQALINEAQRSYPGANFEKASYDDLCLGLWKSSSQFDVAVFNFALFDEDLRPILKKVSSFLKPNGTILIQTLHPSSLTSPYQEGWRTEDFKTFPVAFEGKMPWYGRTLSSWSRVFSSSGLKIKDILEPLSLTTKAPLSIIFSVEVDTGLRG